MGIYLKSFAANFIILLGLLIFVKLIIITFLIAKGEWLVSSVFLLSIIEWNKEALKIVTLIFAAILLAIFRSK